MLTAETGKPMSSGLNETGLSGDRATVAVIIPTFNHASFLSDAIASVLAQTRQADEIIVVDDGSTDDPATVVAQFQKVRLIRQDNRGLAAARNTGLRSCTTSHVVFLDADDRLLPTALQAGLDCIADQPDSAFVYGGYRVTSEDGQPIARYRLIRIEGDAHLALIRGNQISMIATVLFRRDCLLAVNGFDEALRRCEDLDLYLRITQRYGIASHPAIIAEYRMHQQNMSNSYVEMLKTVLEVLDRHEARIAADPLTQAALRDGRARNRAFYVSKMLDAAAVRWRTHHDIGILMKDLIQAARWSPPHKLLIVLARHANKVFPNPIWGWIQRIRGRPKVGSVHFGDFRRLSPISDNFGADRGTPIDRYYIESFLAKNTRHIEGRVLEADSNLYTQRFGGARVEQSDVLSVETDNPRATVVGDLTHSTSLPGAAFDCIVFTQTLQFIFDVRAAVATSYRALKPGGVLLVTVPGLTKMHDRWPWYWTFTASAVRRLLEDQFGSDAVSVEVYGNVFTATAFLYGIATEELDLSELNARDSNFPVIVAARAIKREDA